MCTAPAARSLSLPAKLSSGYIGDSLHDIHNRVWGLSAGFMQRAEDGRVAEDAAVSKIKRNP